MKRDIIKGISYGVLVGTTVILILIGRVFHNMYNLYTNGTYNEETYTNIMNNLIDVYAPLVIINIIVFIIALVLLRKSKKLP